MYTPVNPSFTILKWGLRGSKLYRRVFVMLLQMYIYEKGIWCILFAKNLQNSRKQFRNEEYFVIICFLISLFLVPRESWTRVVAFFEYIYLYFTYMHFDITSFFNFSYCPKTGQLRRFVPLCFKIFLSYLWKTLLETLLYACMSLKYLGCTETLI